MDFHITNHGTIWLIRPVTEAATEWLDRNIGHGPDVQYLGTSVAVEPRYVDDILAGIECDGLRVN